MANITKEMVEKINNSHDTMTEWKPTMERLNEIFRPDGKFDKLYDTAIENKIKINNNVKHISIHWGLLSALFIAALFVLFSL